MTIDYPVSIKTVTLYFERMGFWTCDTIETDKDESFYAEWAKDYKGQMVYVYRG